MAAHLPPRPPPCPATSPAGRHSRGSSAARGTRARLRDRPEQGGAVGQGAGPSGRQLPSRASVQSRRPPRPAGRVDVGEADLPLDETHARVAGPALGGVRRQRELAQAEGTGCSIGVSCATLHSTARGTCCPASPRPSARSESQTLPPARLTSPCATAACSAEWNGRPEQFTCSIAPPSDGILRPTRVLLAIGPIIISVNKAGKQ